MVRGKGHRINEILTPAAKQDLLMQKQELEAALKEREAYGMGTAAEQLDKAKLQRDIKRIDDAIALREPPKLSAVDRDKLVKELEILAEKLQEGLPTRDEMDHPAKNPGAVRKHMRWLERNAINIQRWRYLQRVLNPDDPRSIENMRREK